MVDITEKHLKKLEINFESGEMTLHLKADFDLYRDVGNHIEDFVSGLNDVMVPFSHHKRPIELKLNLEGSFPQELSEITITHDRFFRRLNNDGFHLKVMFDYAKSASIKGI